MDGEPFGTGGIINLVDGETIKDFQPPEFPLDKLFIIEFVGINAGAQPDQDLTIFLQVHTNTVKRIYPIVPMGKSPSPNDPEYPIDIYGSQQVRLYADPNSELIITARRSSGTGGARAIVDLSGRIIPPLNSEAPNTPENLRIN